MDLLNYNVDRLTDRQTDTYSHVLNYNAKIAI